MAGLLDYLGSSEGDGSGLLGYISNHSGGLTGLGAGLLSGNDWQSGMAQGFQSAGAGNMMDSKRAKDRKQENATKAWLAQHPGIDPATQDYLANNQGAADEYFAQSMAPKKPISVGAGDTLLDPNTYKPVYQAPAKANTEGDFGINPIYAQDAAGNTVLLQPKRSGGVEQAQLPDGVKIGSQFEKVDLGTAWGTLDKRTGTIVSSTPKDVAGEASAQVQGRAQGEAAVNLPNAMNQADQALASIDRVREASKKGLFPHTGFGSMLNGVPGTAGVNFQANVDQLKGQTFLQAYNQLKGAGAITDVEGRKAEDAIARLNTSLAPEDFNAALADLEATIVAGKTRLQQKASAAPVAPGAAPQSTAGAGAAQPGVNTTASGVRWSAH